MDESPDSFAYRCLPLTIANGHGWEILCDCHVEAVWTGGQRKQDVLIRVKRPGRMMPISHFGAGVLTFHLNVLIRTDPGFGLWVGGPPNTPKEGIAALSGLVETDWSPMTFTMSWRFTRRNQNDSFEPGEPFCFIFPLPRLLVSAVKPEIRSLHQDPELANEYNIWSNSRVSFNKKLREPDSQERSRKWQKHYHKGRFPSGTGRAPDHLTRLSVQPFRRVEKTTQLPEPSVK